MKDMGTMKKKDARAFFNWWTVRGHSVWYEATGKRGIWRVYLTLDPKSSGSTITLPKGTKQ